MSYAAATSAYREMEVLSASPSQLVLIVYDYLLVQLRRTEIAIQTNKVELRSQSLTNCWNALAELMCGLDMERGGSLAVQLRSLYAFFSAELIDVGRTSDRKRLASVTAQVGELRDAFARTGETHAASAA
jgi:flagellar protein FliS